MDIRYQVFISSTFADLKDERSKVIQTIMELDCIPAGMEIFPAIDEEQFNFIKRIIDDCDYYILIIGGRYGSVSEDGISYTEKEYDYAIEKGIRVIAFIHSNPDEIPLGKSEKDEVTRKKLEEFKKKVSTGRLIKHWSNAEELPGLVALSLPKTIKTYPAIGWIRANSITNPELLEELNNQRKDNIKLKTELEKMSVAKESLEDYSLADLDDSIELFGEFKYGTAPWKLEITWGDVFSVLSPHLMEFPPDSSVKSILNRELSPRVESRNNHSAIINDGIFQTIKIHLKALGLITVAYQKSSTGGMGLFWGLTNKGESLMIDLRSVKKSDDNE
jgi:hypothetical protein